MPLEEYVDVLLKEARVILQDAENYSPSVLQIEDSIGSAVMNRYHVWQMDGAEQGESGAMTIGISCHNFYLL
jgi:hypothetical protein